MRKIANMFRCLWQKKICITHINKMTKCLKRKKCALSSNLSLWFVTVQLNHPLLRACVCVCSMWGGTECMCVCQVEGWLNTCLRLWSAYGKESNRHGNKNILLLMLTRLINADQTSCFLEPFTVKPTGKSTSDSFHSMSPFSSSAICSAWTNWSVSQQDTSTPT